MRYNIYDSSANSKDYITVSGLTVTNYIRLSELPVEPLGAASRSYVDAMTSTQYASYIKSGVFNKDRLPAFTGRVESALGSGVLTLTDVPIVPGTYPKIRITTDGLVSEVSNLSASDIPNINWNKISLGKPTTLEGYGVTNGVSRVDGVLGNPLLIPYDPVVYNDTVTKQYVDRTPLNSKEFQVGDLLIGEYPTVPYGFLRCNGGSVVREMYESLYSVIKNDKTFLITANGKPWVNQYNTNFEENDSFSNWSLDITLPEPLTDSRAAITDNKLYVIGGVNETGISDKVYGSTILSDGGLNSFSLVSVLPVGLAGMEVLLYDNHLYVLGGRTDTSSYSDKIYYSKLSSQGDLGVWETAIDLPIGLSNFTSCIIKNKLFVFGGKTSTSDSASYWYANINNDGSLSNWSVAQSLPFAMSYSQVTMTRNRIYLIGSEQSGVASVKVLSAAINPDGTLGSWIISQPETTGSDNSTFTLEGTVSTFTGGVTDSDTLTVKRDYKNLSVGSGKIASLVVAEDGFITVEYKRSEFVSISLEGTGVYYFPDTAQSFYYTGAGSSGTASPFSVGQIGSFSVGGNTYTLPAGSGGVPNPVSATINLVDGGRTLMYNIPEGGSCDIVYQFENITHSQTYTSDSMVEIPDYVSELTVYGKGSNWLVDLPVPLTRHNLYTDHSACYVVGGVNNNVVYKNVLDDSGILSRWEAVGSLPNEESESVLVVTNNKLLTIGGRVNDAISDTVRSLAFYGGSNKYNGSEDSMYGLKIKPNTFRLPDFTSIETVTGNVFIKY